jgi:hypothetical protein
MFIIQDSHSDWPVETCNMANIYRNALLTIAAASASDHLQGCFTGASDDWEQRWLSLPRTSAGASEQLLLIAEYERCRVRHDSLDQRGWILLEQLLSPGFLSY